MEPPWVNDPEPPYCEDCEHNICLLDIDDETCPAMEKYEKRLHAEWLINKQDNSDPEPQNPEDEMNLTDWNYENAARRKFP